MKIVRGIIGFDNKGEMIVSSPGHIYQLGNEQRYKNVLKEGYKLKGIITENKFNICSEFKNRDGSKIYGYLLEMPELASPVSIQTILGFNENTYEPYNSQYEIGSIIVID